MNIAQIIQSALQLHRAGRLAEAEQMYRQALAQQPNQPDVLHLLGVLVGRTGRHEAAVELIRQAIAANPSVAEYHASLGQILAAAGQFIPAADAYQAAVRLKPTWAEAQNNLCVVLTKSGRIDGAIFAGQSAIRLKPNVAEAHFHLGNALREKGMPDEAIAAWRQAIQLKPAYPQAFVNLGNALRARGQNEQAVEAYRQALRIKPDLVEAHYNLGNALRDLRRIDEATDAYRNALSIAPDYAQAMSNLGAVLAEAEQYDESLAACRHAAELKPDWPEAHNNLGNALRHTRQLDDAIAAYHRALVLKPEYAEAYGNMGVALAEKGLYDDADVAFCQALRIDPQCAMAHWNYALKLLVRGQLAEGWREYEWRWRSAEFPSPRREFVQPMWDGRELHGRTILLHAEQGFGDTLQFIRYTTLVAARGGRVILQCPAVLSRLLETMPALQKIVVSGPLPDFEFQIPLLSLPLIFQTTLQTIPAEVPYLKADPTLATAWSEKLGTAVDQPRIGLVWAGNPKNKNDRNRSMSLIQLAPVFGAGNGVFYSLQKGPAAKQIASAPAGARLIDFTSELKDFADTAALISHLSLVITVDTAVAHLAGALGKPVWVMLPYVPEWRWLLQRRDSPWYPTMRLFRQKTAGDWSDVVAEVVANLPAFVIQR